MEPGPTTRTAADPGAAEIGRRFAARVASAVADRVLLLDELDPPDVSGWVPNHSADSAVRGELGT